MTVEAEPEEEGIPNARTTTRTMKVPLREESPTTEAVKGRGRRSQAGSSGTKRRSTPVRGARSTSKGHRQSVTDLDIRVLGDEEDFNEWSPQKSRKKAKPRNKKKSEDQSGRAVPESTFHSDADDSRHIDRDDNVSEDPGIVVRPDSETEQHAPSAGVVHDDSPEMREIDLNRVSVRSRSRPPKDHKSHHSTKDTNTGLSESKLPTLVSETRHLVPSSAVDGYPTPTSSLRGDSDDVPNMEGDPIEHHEGFDTILESEGFTMIDLESIPSARNFVSPPNERDKERAGQIETPPDKSNNGISLSSPSEPRNAQPISSPAGHIQLKSRPTAIPSYLTFAEGESDLSSTVPSSPPMVAQAIPAPLSDSVHLCTKVTPEPYSSPQLPSPPRVSTAPFRPHVAPTHKPTPPRLARVVRAGIALQGVLSPKFGLEKAQAQSPKLAQRGPKERLDDLFEGFDSGTRRELRAGLRLGEELAKRQKSSSPAEIEKKRAKILSNTQVWRGETTVQHTPTPLPADISDMSEKRACPAMSTTCVEVKRVKGEDGNAHAGLQTPVQAKRLVAETAHLDTQHKEQEWQLEREAVSRQIQNANTSEVIVIDSDGIDETGDSPGARGDLSQHHENEGPDEKDMDETDGDIWLAEAEAHNSSQQHTGGPSPDMFPLSEQKQPKEKAREVITKSRRSVIPSPWKRGEDVDGASTFMTSGDVSGLLWKQPRSSARFGAGAIQRQLQGSSDAFGVGSSQQDTPIRLRQVCEHAKPLSTSSGLTISSAHGECPGETSRDDDPRDQEESREDHDSWDAANDDFDSSNKGGVCETEEQWQENAEDYSDNESMSTRDVSFLQPQPIKIPVKFNDSTLSAPSLSPSVQMSTPQSSRPSTPRSALKGSRSSLGLEDNSGRNVIFSSQSLCVDDDGQKSNAPIKSLSPTPPPSTIPGVVELLQPALPPPTLSRGILEPEPEPELMPEPVQHSWFGWLWGGAKSSLSSSAQLEPTASNQTKAIACVDGAEDNKDSGWRKTKSNIRSSSRHDSKVLPSFLRPPSYPSDPCHDVSVPLATTGDFTNVHFRTLHIIYRKSLRPRFHGPSAIRPGLRKMVGEKFTCDEGEYGDFAWEVDRDAVVVVERFMMEVEFGWEGKGHVEWGWTEKELCHRLFRIIVGEEVRREQAAKKGQHGRKERVKKSKQKMKMDDGESGTA